MPLIVTPGQLSRRAEIYHQLGTAIGAGIPLTQALEMAHGSSAARSIKHSLGQVIALLHQGETLADALRSIRGWLPEFDVSLISAGEKSGRLDATLRSLSDYYGERARLVRSVMVSLAYPILIVHFAVFIFPPSQITSLVMNGEVKGFFTSKLATLIPLYLVVFLIVFACQGQRGERWRALMERFLRMIPILGTARRSLALARLSAALEGLINAGVSIIEAWELAAAASGSPALRRVVKSWRPSLEAGQTPAEKVRASAAFPDVFVSLYHSGELSGQLDTTLRRLYRYYEEEASRKLRAVAEWTPKLIYLAIVLLIAYQIVSFWTNYYGNIMQTF